MACRGNISELRQILWIRDIGRGIRLSAFEALPRIRLAGCTRHVISSGAGSSKQMTRHEIRCWARPREVCPPKETRAECGLLARWLAGRRNSRS